MASADRMASRISAIEALMQRPDQVAAAIAAFKERIAGLALTCAPDELGELQSFGAAIIASRDPFLLSAFQFVEFGDWNL